MKKSSYADWYRELQRKICRALEKADGKGKFQEHRWKRKGGGGGATRVLERGAVIEKGGVNCSEVYGKTPEKILKALGLIDKDFYATGISIVIHPENPMIPIIHMNLRYFEMSNGLNWFGGGIDLTPHYIDLEDARFFHEEVKKACDRHHPKYYPEFKQWADNYFYLKHREETRGIGGIFFDRLSATDEISLEERFAFSKEVGKVFTPIYRALIKKNKGKTYGEKEKQWQMIRRSRYVEFNLVWDLGTKFGLDTKGRTESILMSLPPGAEWHYDFKPEANSYEERTQKLLRKEINWLDAQESIKNLTG